MPNTIEYLRKTAVDKLFSMSSFQDNWDTSWRNSIEVRLGQNPSPRNILDLGDHLASIFEATGVAGRAQAQVSAAGHTWEALVCWYLNLCLANTRVVVIKQSKELVPEPIRDAITVLYGNFPSNTEADLIAITFPDDSMYTNDISNLNSTNELSDHGINTFTNRGRFKYKEIIDYLTARDFGDCEVNVIQCKTNWNDNSQIPMLWDMIYSAQGFNNQVHVGRNGYNVNSLNHFSYSFVTVPTVDRNRITANSVQVKRVTNMSGGNFWGHPTQDGVAKSIKEIINRNYSNGTNNNVLTNSLPSVLQNLQVDFSYFKIL